MTLLFCRAYGQAPGGSSSIVFGDGQTEKERATTDKKKLDDAADKKKQSQDSQANGGDKSNGSNDSHGSNNNDQASRNKKVMWHLLLLGTVNPWTEQGILHLWPWYYF